MKKKFTVKIECVIYEDPPGSKIDQKPSQSEMKRIIAKEIADLVLAQGNVFNVRDDGRGNRIMAQMKRVKI